MSAGSKAKNRLSWDFFESEAFEDLLRNLAEIVRESGKELDEMGLQSLRAGVRAAVTNYGVLQFTEDYVSKITLHELEKPLARVIEILKREDNVDPVIVTLGSEQGSFYCDIEFGVERRKAVIADLEKIAARKPPSRRAGRKGNRDLHHLVHSLANEWVVLTGTRFTQMWADNGQPGTSGALFVDSVLRFIDQENLKALPKMTERVVNERNRGMIMPWLNIPKATSAK
jgi:hypothetical protein